MSSQPTLPPRVAYPCPGCHRSIHSPGHIVTTIDEYNIRISCPLHLTTFTQALLLPVNDTLPPEDTQIALF